MNTMPTNQQPANLGTPPQPQPPRPPQPTRPAPTSTGASAGAAARASSMLKVGIALGVVAAVVSAAIVIFTHRDTNTPPRRTAAAVTGFDYLAAKAKDLGDDRDGIISYVRDEVKPEQYDGELRGAVA